MHNISYSFNTSPIINSPSPARFPSASPKHFSMPTQKIPETKPWQEIALESVPQNSANIYSIRENGSDLYSREKVFYRQTNDTSSPSTIGQSEDIDMSSYYFSENDFLSSIISSRPSTCSPALHKSNSFSIQSSSDPIVGNPYVPPTNDDPVERHRRFSIGSPSHEDYLECTNLKTVHKNGFISFKGLISKMKKVAGRPIK